MFSPPAGAKVVMASSSARVEKMFASFDLGSVSISFVGMMGDFAVWVKVSNITMTHSDDSKISSNNLLSFKSFLKPTKGHY